ncbi:MAG: glycosyl hydrolase [Cytophagaceae bacterium]|jgi:beta-galactosidase/beta-glucuronidase|nr:glycosyl hydrolase [Cytophagaceae bacterium]
MKHTLSLFGLLFLAGLLSAQNRYELNSGWKYAPISNVKDTGEAISAASYSVETWKPAVVPGTVLTSQLANGDIPDPFYGMNNELIPDIYNTGREYYTYWFVKNFTETQPKGNEQVWLTFRGINYSCDIYLNGQKVNKEPYEGMFLRKSFNITAMLTKDGNNRLAVIVHPVDPVGEPNGGQGGDGVIARNNSHQYVAGWDWIQPIRDRNTGIWDKVYIEKTGLVNIMNPHVVTQVYYKPQGINGRAPVWNSSTLHIDDLIPQGSAKIKTGIELQNTSDRKISGTVSYRLDSIYTLVPKGSKSKEKHTVGTIYKKVTLEPHSVTEVELPEGILKNARLWYPAGYGEQNLYSIRFEFVENRQTAASDSENVTFGIREIKTEFDTHTGGMMVRVNGEKIFIKGGNWIISDAMLRFSRERYDAEIRYHRDMNLNLIRIWGGALTERPEFYEACDRYGLLVMQDFWMSGDCNGRWLDPKKKDDMQTRRKYPDNHALFLESAADMIKMIRNHPSLALWCGGNEIMPPTSILLPLRDTILPKLDGTRTFIDYSNSDQMSYNSIGGNGDGPYGIQDPNSFWQERTFPFNSEVGSVGVGDYESLVRFIPESNMKVPVYNTATSPRETADSVWTYHTYTGVGYNQHIAPYGDAVDVRDFARKAQLVNYNQYRALIEGFSSHIWKWYTGTIIWKTQNPWTSMRGQMYDCYLDPNACLFGLRKGSESVHIMCNPVTGMVMVVNNGFEQLRDVTVVVKAYDFDGNETELMEIIAYVEASDAKNISSVKSSIDKLFAEKGGFLYLQLLDESRRQISDNFYWYADSTGNYSGLKYMQPADCSVSANRIADGKIEITLSNNASNPISFFNRLAVVDANTDERILPAFYDDNYVSVLPGKEVRVMVEYPHKQGVVPRIIVEGWNMKPKTVDIWR